MWISLAALLADCLIKLGWLVLRPLLRSSAVRIYLRVRERSHEYSRVLPIQTEDREDEDSLASSMHSQEDEAPSPVEACATVSPQLTRQSEKHEDRMKVWPLCGFLTMSLILCIMSVKHLFGSHIGASMTILAFVLSLPLSIMGIRAVGETDWNPMSGIGECCTNALLWFPLSILIRIY